MLLANSTVSCLALKVLRFWASEQKKFWKYTNFTCWWYVLRVYLLLLLSDSRNDVPHMAQQYRTMAMHTWYRASVLDVFVVFCMHMYSFAGLIRHMPPQSPTATLIPLFTSSEHTGRGYHCLLDRKNHLDMYRLWESNSWFPVWTANLSTRPGAMLRVYLLTKFVLFIQERLDGYLMLLKQILLRHAKAYKGGPKGYKLTPGKRTWY